VIAQVPSASGLVGCWMLTYRVLGVLAEVDAGALDVRPGDHQPRHVPWGPMVSSAHTRGASYGEGYDVTFCPDQTSWPVLSSTTTAATLTTAMAQFRQASATSQRRQTTFAFSILRSAELAFPIGKKIPGLPSRQAE
jgi:hypothetical protein